MYRGMAATFLGDIDIGDSVIVKKKGKVFTGVLMPRNELADDRHIVIKLASGYNIGIKVDKSLSVKLVEKAKSPEPVAATAVQNDPDLPTITILGTGGTIASKIDYKTGAVAPAFSAAELHRAIPELSKTANIRTRMLFNILSENMTPERWSIIAKAAAEELNAGVDGVVIAHGTDTMGYTGAALSFMLQGLSKPVVLVGSQRSSDRPSSDSAMNLVCAARVAVADVAGVFVVMHRSMNDDTCLIHRGTRVRKMHSSRRDAFRSVNAKPVGEVGDEIRFYEKMNRRGSGPVTVEEKLEHKVALVKVYPGMTTGVLDPIIKSQKGIVLEGTGLGHVPEAVLPSVEAARKKGVHVVMTTQTIYGRVDMKVYATGRRLLEQGVIPGGDILSETALVKLMHVLGQTKDAGVVRRLMQKDLAGELSNVSGPDGFPE